MKSIYERNTALFEKITDENRRRLWTTLFKLAGFCLILLINQKFLYQIFFIPAQLWYRYFGAEASYDTFYFISWLTSDVCSYLVPALAAYFLFRRDRLPLQRHVNYKAYAEMPLIFFATCFLGSLASLLAQWISMILDAIFGTGEIPDAMAGTLPEQGQQGSAWIFILFVVVLAPICEELIFRKLLLQPLRCCGDIFAVVASALIFGAYHGNFDQFPYAFVVGLLYGILVVRSGSVIPTMVLHLLNNLLVSVGSYLTDMLGKELEWAVWLESWSVIVMNLAFWVGIPAVVLMFIKRMHKSDREEELTVGEKAKELFRNPAFYLTGAAVVMMLV